MNTAPLSGAILADQLLAVRETVLISIPVNILLGIAVMLVAWHSDQGSTALIWFSFSSIINVFRILLCRSSLPTHDIQKMASQATVRTVRSHLSMHWMLSLASGIVWAFIPGLCNGYQSPETLFYLTVVCGITAGAVTHGFAYARIPICFISPPLLSVIACLLHVGGFDRNCLAATVVLYLVALIRGTWVGEDQVKNESRLKHEATALSRSLESANLQVRNYADQMQTRAVHDDLTGLLNRRGFLEGLVAILGSRSSADSVCAMLLLDVDGFKPVNDTLGHNVGDQVLVEVARRLERISPPEAVLCRLGGDEFAIFLYGIPTYLGEDLAGTAIAAIAKPFERFGSVHIGCSVGIYSGAQIDTSEMLLCADAALYSAKSGGRNRWCLYDEDLRLAVETRRDVERDLPEAIENRDIVIWYQPIMSDYGSAFDSVEALVRWHHPKHGWIAPPTIIQSAATIGLAKELFLVLLANVIDTIMVLEANGFGHTRVAMNISPREMVHIAIDDLILDDLQRVGLSASRLELEITEDTAINLAAIKTKLRRLSKAGVTIAIDDFGTGYSSLGSLQQLRADRVKIDMAFVSGIATSDVNSSLVEAILRISTSFGFEVVAEGVETQGDFDRLKDLGCSHVQGYLFAKPMTRSDLLVWAASIRSSS